MTTHALYRFFDGSGELLYIGITMNLGGRWKQHQFDKPWWSDVVKVTIETFTTRQGALSAEREAILAEKPRYNIIHNHGTTERPVQTVTQERLLPIQVGDWAALGLGDGRCPVGAIVAMDDIWISLRLKSFLSGFLTGAVIVVRWAEIERIELAYPEDAPDGQMNDDHLGEFQSAWAMVHEMNPVDKARHEVRTDNALRIRGAA